MKKKLVVLVALCNFVIFAVTPAVIGLTPVGNPTKTDITTNGHGVGY